MQQLFSDIIGFTKNLSQVDFLLYFAILVLIVLVVSLIYIMKNSEDIEESQIDNFNKEDVDINEIVTNINNIDSKEQKTIEFTRYEKDQEEKAIISYDELIERNKFGNINYNEEENIDNEVSVKKINLDNIISSNKQNKKEKNEHNKLFDYANEEAFLKTLKLLNELLD